MRSIINKRKIRSQQTRQRLLDAGLELFVSKGYGGTTIRGIAAKAGVSPGLLFHYFSSKEAILRELIDVMNGGVDSLAAQLRDSTQPPLKAFEMVATIILESFKDERGHQLFLLFNQLTTAVHIPQDVRSQLHHTVSLEASLPMIRRGQKLNQIKPGDPRMLALVFWAVLHGIAELLVWQPDMTIPTSDYVIATLIPQMSAETAESLH